MLGGLGKGGNSFVGRCGQEGADSPIFNQLLTMPDTLIDGLLSTSMLLVVPLVVTLFALTLGGKLSGRLGIYRFASHPTGENSMQLDALLLRGACLDWEAKCRPIPRNANRDALVEC